jgi:hypothetical protein
MAAPLGGGELIPSSRIESQLPHLAFHYF